MRNLKALTFLFVLFSTVFTGVSAADIEVGCRYYITCDYAEGYVAIGSLQGKSYPLYYVASSTAPTDEEYFWYIDQDMDGYYSFRNAFTGQYLTWSENYQNDRYMNLADELDDYCLWIINEYNDSYYIDNKQESAYHWNLRTGSFQLGTYSNAAFSGTSNSCFKFVKVDTEPPTLVTDITLDHTALKMPVGGSYQLNATVLPTDATRPTLSWNSDNSNVLKVAQGKLTAVSEGTANLIVAATDVSGVKAYATVEVYHPDHFVDPTAGDTLFVFQTTGRMDAFPEKLIVSREEIADGGLKLTLKGGAVYQYKGYEIEELRSTFEGLENTLPELESFKFNNKYNDQLMADIEAPVETVGSDANGPITRLPRNTEILIKSAIGKYLTASFKTTSDDANVYVDGVQQFSKETRRRFDEGLVQYVVTPGNYNVYSFVPTIGAIYDVSDPYNPVTLVEASGECTMQPFGNTYNINIKWATDSRNNTAAYGIPTVYIQTDDGKFITSKTTYKTAKISIDGSGIFDDLPETVVNIKGRGNTSWGGASATATGSSNSKNPYRLKFDSKQKILGMKKGKNWVLLANKQSGSMTTNALSMKMADMVASPACNHIIPVELYINGDYRGSYNMTEKIGFANNSVDLDDESGAFLLQLDSYYDETYKFKDSSFSLPTMVMEPDLEDEVDATIRTNKLSAIKAHFNNFTSVLKKGDSSYDKLLDVDAFARTMFVTDLARNCELKHPKSWYIYTENAYTADTDGFTLNLESQYVLGPVWDFDWAYGYDGTFQYFVNKAEESVFENGSSGTPFFQALRYNSDKVKKAYYSLWHHFMTSGQLTELLDYCDDYYDFVQKSFKHDATLWGDPDYVTHTARSKTWLEKRANWLYKNLDVYDLSDEVLAEIALGDANGSGLITVADVACVLNYTKGITNDNLVFDKADADENGILNIRDMVAIRALAESTEEDALADQRNRLPVADAALRLKPFKVLMGTTAEIPLELIVADGEYNALQFDMTLPEYCEPESFVLPEEWSGFQTTMQWLDARTCRVLIYAPANTAFPEGISTLTMQFMANDMLSAGDCVINIHNALLADHDSDDFRLSSGMTNFVISDDATGLASTDIHRESTVSTYDLSGRRVNTAQHGVFIINGQKVIK